MENTHEFTIKPPTPSAFKEVPPAGEVVLDEYDDLTRQQGHDGRVESDGIKCAPLSRHEPDAARSSHHSSRAFGMDAACALTEACPRVAGSYTCEGFPCQESYEIFLQHSVRCPPPDSLENTNLTPSEETFVEGVVQRHGTPEAIESLSRCEQSAIRHIVAGGRFFDLNVLELAALRRFIIRLVKP